MDLRWYQSEACEAVWNCFRNNQGNPLIELPTGAGKSLCIAELCRAAVQDHAGQVIVLAHRKELLEQNYSKIVSLLPPSVKAGLFSAGLRRFQQEEPIIVAGIQSCYEKASWFGRRHLVIVDECFTGETEISTPDGMRRIDELKCGDAVFNATGIGLIEAVSCRSCFDILEVKLSDGTVTRCTENHMWFTSRGWCKAGALGIGEVTYGVQAMCFLWEGVQAMEEDKCSRSVESFQRVALERSKVLLSILLEEAEESNEQPSVSLKDARKTQRDSTQTYKARRQRAITNLTTACTIARFRGGVGVGSSNSDRLQPDYRIGDVSNQLQSRHREQREEDSNRNRREFTLLDGTTGTRSEERRASDFARVVSVSRVKRESPVPVFNLQVSGHPSYFANGKLVHNCHLVPSDGNGMYQTFLTDLQRYNDRLRIVGLTATPFRTGEGALWGDDCLFTHVCYSAGLRRLIDEGFLCPITSKPTRHEYDTSGLKVKRGEFVERDLVSLFGDQSKVLSSTQEIVEKTAGRRSILVFTTGVAHAELVQKSIEELTGERVGIVTGDTMALERATLLEEFRTQKLRWLVNIDVLCVGFDAPCIDALAILRATASPGLFAQICGRGLRKHHSKTECLILDFGENIKRHGPLDDLNFGKQKKRGASEFEGETPMKECPNCKSAVPVSRKECDCGWMFPGREINHEEIADTESKILSEPESFEVTQVVWGRHSKREGTDSLRVDYQCTREDGNIEERISEWVCIEHEGFARRKAEQWWKAHCLAPCPETIDEALDYLTRGAVALPSAIVARKEGKFWRVTHQTLGTLPPEQDWIELEAVKELEEEEMPF